MIWLFCSQGFAQITFEKTFGNVDNERGSCVRQLYDGGYIVLGTYTGDGTLVVGTIMLISTDSLGNERWNKSFSGLGFGWGNNLEITSDSGFIIVGSTSTFGDPTTHDVLLIKTDSAGNQSWFQNYDSLQTAPVFGSHEEGYDVAQTSDGGYILTGAAGGAEMIMIKTDSLGDILWTKKDTGLAAAVGRSIAQAENGNYLVFGSTTSPTASETLMYLVKIDSAGNKIWGQTYTWSGGNYTDGFSVKVNNSGEYLLFGTGIYTGNSTGEMLLIKTDTAGSVIWQKKNKIYDFSQGYDFDITNDGGYILAGKADTVSNNDLDVYIVKTDSSGTKQWEKTIGGSVWDWGTSIKQTNDNGFVIVGTTYSYGSGMSDIYLIKTDSIGYSPPYTSIHSILTEQIIFNIYPNPTTGRFTLEIDLQETTNLNVRLHHITGQLISSGEIDYVIGNYTQQMDLSKHSKGIYYMQVVTDVGVISKKVIYQ